MTISLALNENYHEIRENVKWLINDDGGLRTVHMLGILDKNGYETIEYNGDYTVNSLLRILDSSRNAIIFYIENHTFFVYDFVIYDSTNRQYSFIKLMNEKVNAIQYKPVEGKKWFKEEIKKRISEIDIGRKKIWLHMKKQKTW